MAEEKQTNLPTDLGNGPRWIKVLGKETGIAKARELFLEQFGYQASGEYAAPGRVNLIGEHIDYAGGTVLPLALPNRAYAVAAGRSDQIVRVSSKGATPTMVECDLKDVAPGHPNNWAGYLIGAIWAAVQAGIIPARGIDLAMVSDVPFGSGLSSSAAIESVALAAVCGENGIELTEEIRSQLVACAMRAENEIVGAATGGMDQKISLHGKENYLLAINFREGSTRYIPFRLEEAGLALLVCNTNASHSLADGQYESRRRVIDGVAETMGVEKILDAPSAAECEPACVTWAAANQPENEEASAWLEVVNRRVGHIWSEEQRTVDAIAALEAKDYEQLGQLMWQSHHSLKEDYEVSVPELDLVVDCAKEIGALGARMTGGGFGGSAIALLPSEKVEMLAELIARKAVAAGFPIPEFEVATASNGAEIISPEK